jgi:peptidoglycan/xylan/chitin deacetylase (PgdA/CDA1 family)
MPDCHSQDQGDGFLPFPMTGAITANTKWYLKYEQTLALLPEVNMTDANIDSVPILMYHRIATDGPPGLKRWRMTPELFAAHMNVLFRAGYRTITLAEWAEALVQRRPVRGKRVLLTFDDGYSDFLSGAIPILHRHDFSATVFLVAEQIGKTALWDADFGDCASLLSWEEIKSLQEIGIEFGGHSCIHRKMTEMGSTELAEDTRRTRMILEEGLGVPVPTLAYPYGEQNEFVRRVVGEVGTTAAVTCEPGISKLGDDPLRLPRIEIVGDCTTEQLISLVERTG